MTDAERWEAGEPPERMIMRACDAGVHNRKLRLFAFACWLRIQHLLVGDDTSHCRAALALWEKKAEEGDDDDPTFMTPELLGETWNRDRIFNPGDANIYAKTSAIATFTTMLCFDAKGLKESGGDSRNRLEDDWATLLRHACDAVACDVLSGSVSPELEQIYSRWQSSYGPRKEESGHRMSEAADRGGVPELLEVIHANGATERALFEKEDELVRSLPEFQSAFQAEQANQILLVRDIFGNVFRPAAFSPSWRTDTVLSLAQGMYESRDFTAMPILADALQDAGCDNDDVLSHCRDANATHVRGCWVVDLVLGKE